MGNSNTLASKVDCSSIVNEVIRGNFTSTKRIKRIKRIKSIKSIKTLNKRTKTKKTAFLCA